MEEPAVPQRLALALELGTDCELSRDMFTSKPKKTESYEEEIRNTERTYRLRAKLDRVQTWLRSCAVCETTLPPIDLICDVCWQKVMRLRNRGRAMLQEGYPFPVYALFTWTEETEAFIKPLVYGFKKGRSVQAAEDLALEFVAERSEAGEFPKRSVLIPPPSDQFDHGTLWAKALSDRTFSPVWPVLRPQHERPTASQKRLSREERSERRYEIREQIAGSWPLGEQSGRLIFTDDVVTSGSTAMAAFMALGDPEQYEVWCLVARPRIATH